MASAAEEAVVTGDEVLVYLAIDALLLAFAAVFAGLTLSLMGLDTLSLEIIATSGREPDRTYAKKLIPIRKKGNQLLCTLVLGTVMVNTLIAQVTDRFVTGWVGTALSTALITVGGEIIPQASMSAHALQVGASSVPVVQLFLFLFYPVCKPISLILDSVIGSDPGQIYDRNELRKLMALHAGALSKESGIRQQDVELMLGAMDLHDKEVIEAMTPLSDTFMIEANELISDATLHSIWASGHSRVPVYRGDRTNVIGVLFTKDLLLWRPEERPSVLDVMRFYPRTCLTVNAETKLIAMLREFQTGRSHIATVRRVTIVGAGDPVYEVVGIVTLEDVIEELIRGNISDEFETRRERRPDESRRSDIAVRESRWKGMCASALRTMRQLRLPESQAKVAAFYLADNVPAFRRFGSEAILHGLFRDGHVFDFKGPANGRTLPTSSRSNLWLYKKGAPSNFFTLVVSGVVEVFVASAGDTDEKRQVPSMELSQWAVMGSPALNADSFMPDFSARIIGSATVFLISFQQFSRFSKSLQP